MNSRRPDRDPDARLERLAQREPTLGWWLEVRDAANDERIDTDVERSCTGKDRYATQAAARAVAAMNGMGKELFTYECRYCLQWHLTRRPTK